MTGPPPTLKLRCGACGPAPNLAWLTPAAAPRIAGSAALPGDDYVLQPRRGVNYAAYPRNGSATDFVHVLRCPRCPATHKISGPRLAGWWAEFAATLRRTDVRYLGRDQ